MASIWALTVGGGGGGGDVGVNPLAGGGGGAGGYQENVALSASPQAYTITVGAGGAINSPNVGGSSSIGSILISSGGGYGGPSGTSGGAGASGGGGGGANPSGAGGPGPGTAGQGNSGGAGFAVNNNFLQSAGGGGGASAVGVNAISGQGGNGGAGTASSISGSSVTRAGGGGGGAGNVGGTGGAGGGGNGAGSGASTAGTANTGGGGGGGKVENAIASVGGSGIVIIAYHTDGSDGVSPTSTGGTITTVGAYTIHTFTSSGTFTLVGIPPTVTTQSVSQISFNSAIGNGNITNISGELNNIRGIVYDVASHALPGNVAPGASGYAGNATESGSFGTGAFSEIIAPLSVFTTYFVRAYSHNSAGYAYGNEVSFTSAAIGSGLLSII